MLTGASRGDFAVKCPEGSTELVSINSLAATIEAGPGNLFGLDTGMTGDDLGTAPTRPDSFTEIADANIPSQNQGEISLSASKINGQSLDENQGIGSIEFGEGKYHTESFLCVDSISIRNDT